MRKLLGILSCGAFLLLGCRADIGTEKTDTTLRAIGEAPEFDLQTVIGNEIVRSADLKNKVVVVDFWATWCPPCIQEIPNYNKLNEEIVGKDVVLLGITVLSGGRDDVESKVHELGIRYPVVMGTDEVEQGFGGTLGLPTTYVVGKDWKVYKRYLGYRPQKKADIDRVIAMLLSM